MLTWLFYLCFISLSENSVYNGFFSDKTHIFHTNKHQYEYKYKHWMLSRGIQIVCTSCFVKDRRLFKIKYSVLKQWLYNDKKKIISTRKPFHELENEIEIKDRQVSSFILFYKTKEKQNLFIIERLNKINAKFINIFADGKCFSMNRK